MCSNSVRYGAHLSTLREQELGDVGDVRTPSATRCALGRLRKPWDHSQHENRESLLKRSQNSPSFLYTIGYTQHGVHVHPGRLR